jgi:signal transduction histidine kinase
MSPWWEIAFRDSGQGIPAEVLPQVFRPMFTTKPEGKGTGLGLAICREIVRGHGGDIRIESAEGQGTSVIFTLPGAAEAAAPDAGSPPSAP